MRFDLDAFVRLPAERERIAARVMRADVGELQALAAELRSGWAAPATWRTLSPSSAEVLVQGASTGTLGLLSMHRSGYIRQIALAGLASADESGALRFLALRLDDVVVELRVYAADHLSARLGAADLEELVRILPLLVRLSRRQRAGKSPALREVRRTIGASERGRDALVRGTSDPDPEVRLASLGLLREVDRGAALEGALQRAISDPDPTVARWAAIEASSGRVAPEAQARLLPLLERHPDPEIRRRAVLAWARRADDLGRWGVLRALCDSRSRVRHAARVRAGGAARARYREALGGDGSGPLLGALGGLAEAGLPEDLELVRPFLLDPRARVRAEAARCFAFLGTDAHADDLARARADRSGRVRREAARAKR
jgi:hypothetical protein